MKEDQNIHDVFDSYNIKRNVGYHNEIKRLFQNEICLINRKLENKISSQKRHELETKIHRYTEDYYPQMIITSFLMMFSYLEEFLYQVKHRYRSQENFMEREGCIGRFKKIVKDINGKIVTSKEWQFFINAEIVRNCLLHANGRIDILKHSKDKEKLEKIIKSSKRKLNLEISRVVILPEYISDFSNHIESFQCLIRNSLIP